MTQPVVYAKKREYFHPHGENSVVVVILTLKGEKKGGLNDVLQYTRLNTSFIILVQMFQKLPLYLNALGSLHSLKCPGAFVCETD